MSEIVAGIALGLDDVAALGRDPIVHFPFAVTGQIGAKVAKDLVYRLAECFVAEASDLVGPSLLESGYYGPDANFDFVKFTNDGIPKDCANVRSDAHCL
jgi:hypothetical protein